MSKFFIDTNIWIYTLDKKDEAKQKAARDILKKLASAHKLVVSTQVIKEFYVSATNKLKADQIVIKNIVHNFRNMEIVQNDLELIEQAIDISVISRIAFWDSLIIAAAEKANCEFVFSEDLNNGQNYRGIKVVNPFIRNPL